MKRILVSKAAHRVSHFAHHLEHPVHLVYFALVASHGAYHLAAIGCLILGCIALIPGSEPLEAIEEAVND